MVTGVAGRNIFEHIDTDKYSVVYGIDVNSAYLHTVKKRYAFLLTYCEVYMHQHDKIIGKTTCCKSRDFRFVYLIY